MSWKDEELAELPPERLSAMLRDGEISPNAARRALNSREVKQGSGTDFGNPVERAAALRVALACKELNAAISDAHRLGVFVKVADIAAAQHESTLQVRCMERRTMILPTAISAAEDAA